MKQKNKCLQLVICCFLFLTGISIGRHTVWAVERFTVKVGYCNSEFLQIKSGGVYTGYGHEVLRMIAQYEPVKYEYVYGSPKKLKKMLEEGEVDVIAPLNRTKKLEEKFDFTDLSIGSSQMVLSAKDNSNIKEKLYSERVMIGMVKGTTANTSSLMKYCKENGIDAAVIMYDSFNILKDNVQLSTIDAAFCNRWDMNGFQLLARFGSQDMYFAIKKGNSKILDYFNEGLQKVEADNPEYRQSLYEKYYAQNDITGTVLNAEETAFIQDAEVVKVAVPGNMEPLYYEQGNGNFSGIHIHILDMIAENTGLKFEYINAGNLENALKMLQDGEAQVLCGITNNTNWAEQHDLLLTSEYMDNVMVTVKKEDRDLGKSSTLAVYNNTYNLSGYFGTQRAIYPMLEDCFQAVYNEEADFAFGNIYAVEVLKLKAKYRDFIVSTVAERGGSFCFALPNAEDTTLYHILNKAVKRISSDDVEEFVTEESLSRKAEFSLSGYIYEHTVGFVFVIVSAAAAVVFLSVRAMKKGTFMEKGLIDDKQLLQNSLDSLMEFSGDNLFTYNPKSDVIIFSKSMADQFGLNREYKHFKKFRLAERKVHPDDLKCLFEMEESLMQKKLKESTAELRIDRGENRFERYQIYTVLVTSADGAVKILMGRIYNKSEVLLQKQQDSDTSGIYSYLEIRDAILHVLEKSGERDKHAMIVMNFEHLDGNFADDEREPILRAAECIQSCVRATDLIGCSDDGQLLLFIKKIQSRTQIESKLDKIKGLLKEEFYSDDIGLTAGYSVYPMQGGDYEELYEKAVSDISSL